MKSRRQKGSEGKTVKMAVPEKDLLLGISQAASRISDLQRLLRASVRIAGQGMGVDRCSVWLADDNRKYAKVEAVWVKGRFRSVHLGARIDLKNFPKLKRIISEGKTIHSPDIVKGMANRYEKRLFAQAGIKSSLSVPLKIKNRVLGAVNFGTLRDYRTFTPTEIRLGKIIANQVAVGIENAELCRKLEDRTAGLREQSIKALRDSEEKYRTLLENLPQLIFLKDKRSVYVSVNKNFCKSMGIKAEQIIGKTDFDFFPRELARKYRKDDREILRTGKTKEIVEDYVRKGRRRIVQTVKTPILADDGKPIGVLGIFWDITQRRQTEEALQHSEERFRSLIENASDAVAILDRDMTIRYHSPSLERVLGWKPEETVGKKAADFVHPDDFPQVSKAFEGLIKDPKTTQSTEYRARHKNGSWRILEAVGKNLINHPAVKGVVVNYRDVTERKEAEQIQSVLYKIADSVHRVRDLHELFQTIHKVLSTVMDTTNFFIALYDKANDTVSLPYCVDQKDRFQSFPAGKTLTAYVIKQGKPLLVTKEVRKRLIESGKVETIGARSKIWLGVPLKLGGEVIGVVTVQSYTNPLAYGRRELEILKYASTQIATAIQRKKAESTLIRDEQIARERARLLTDLRSLDDVDDILTRVCRAVNDSGLFRRAVMTLNKPGGEIIHLGQVGLSAAVLQRARRAPPLDPKLRARITNKRFRVSDSFFVPVEAGVDFSRSRRHIPEKGRKEVYGDWQAGDELFVPLRDFSGKIMGYLSADTPVDGSRPDKKTVEALEMLVEAAASRIREVEAQKSVKKQRDFSQSITETANSMIVCLDHDARITVFNRECERVTGYSRQEVLGKRWPEIFLPREYRHEKLKSFAGWVRAHPRDQYEGPVKTKKGEIRTILWSNTAILGPKKKDLIAIAIGQDITERKKTEEALQDSERRFRTIVETAPSLLIITDDAGHNLYVSPNCKEITGYTQKELLGKMIWWVHDDDAPEAKKLFDYSFLKKKGFQNYEYKAVKKNGELWYASSSGEPLRDEKGKFKGIVLQTSDVTERKLTEEALKLSQERYKLSTEAAKVGVWDWDLKSNTFYIDPNIKKILGYKDKEIPNDIEVWVTYVHPDDLKPVMAAAQACIDGKTPRYVFEHRMMHKDGSIRWILSNGKVIRDKDGNAVRMIGTDTDVTKRKMAEEAFRESEQRFRMMAEASPDYIFQTDKSGKTIYCSPAIERILGYTPEERQGRKFSTIISPSELSRAKALFGKVIGGETVQNLEINLIHKSGRTVPIEVSVVPFYENGKVTRLFGIARDITLRKQSEAALRESEQKYRSLFEDSPISLWEEDFSEVKRYVDELKQAGVKDFRTYFENRPKAIAKCTATVKVLDLNRPTLRLFGARSKDQLKRGLLKTFVKESYEAFKEELIAISEGKTMFETEAVTQTLKGERINTLIRWTVAPGCEQTFSKVLVSVIDITHRKQVEEALKESRKFLDEIIDHIPDPVFIKDREHKWILLNKALGEMVGYPREKMLGKSDHDFFPKKQADFFWKKDEEMFRTGKVVDIPEEPITDAQGNIHWLHTKKAPLEDSSGKINTLVGIIRDITDQKKAVEALRKSKDLTTILGISHKTTQILDLDKMLKLACEETARALEVDRCVAILFDEEEKEGTIRGIYVRNQPHPPELGEKRLLKDFPQLVRLYRRKKRFLHAPTVEDTPLSQKEKNTLREAKLKSFVIVPIDTGKKLLGCFTVGTTKKERVFSDAEITFVQTLASHLAVAVHNIKLMDLVKEQAENLRTLAQRVVRAQEEERKKIAQELHDEIGQILTVMKLNMEMSRREVPPEYTQVIDRIKDSEDLVRETLNEIRNLTANLRPTELDDFGLIPTLNSYVENFYRRTNIRVVLKAENYPGMVPGDVEMVLYRTAQEALTNVAKHAKATQVSIRLEKKNNHALLTVKDDGVGFDAEGVMRQQKARKGFGLFDIKERVKLLNGSFSITSKPKKGTRLQVRIPCPKGR